MKRFLSCAVLVLGCAAQAGSVAAVAQETTEAAKASSGASEPTKTGIADGASSPDEMGNRRPLYRLQKSDVIEIKFTFVPEFDQTTSVQPDGFIALKGLDQLYAKGLTVAELRNTLREATLRRCTIRRSQSVLRSLKSLISSPAERWHVRASTNCATTPR